MHYFSSTKPHRPLARPGQPTEEPMIRAFFDTALDTLTFVAAMYTIWALVAVYQAGLAV